MWTSPAVWADAGELMLLVFTEHGVPTWEIHSGTAVGPVGNSTIKSGTADTFEAAKAAVLYEAQHLQDSETR
jgi:hypothetical protein